MIRLPVLHSEESEACWWQFLLFSQRVLHIKKRLTTRWSGPGQLGAIIRTCLGRAAQLEAVMRRSPPHRLLYLQYLCAARSHLGVHCSQRLLSPAIGEAAALSRRTSFERGERSAGVAFFNGNHGSTPLQHLPLPPGSSMEDVLPARAGPSSPDPFWRPCQ